MSDGAKITVDLFGDVTTLLSGRRGRPSHQWSQSAENRVILGLAMGYSVSVVAKGLGISEPTLRKHYFSALKMRDMHRARLDLFQLEKLAEAAATGNVGAIKEIDKRLQRADRARRAAELEAAQDAGAQDAPAMPEGKKARAKAQAAEAQETGWGGDLNPGNYH